MRSGIAPQQLSLFETPGKQLLFTERDFSILYSLYKYQLLTTHQLTAIHHGSEQKTRWRLRELYDHGFVHRYNIKIDYTEPGSKPYTYALTDKGANWLSDNHSDIERPPKRYNDNNARRTIATIPHSLMVSDIMVRIEHACYFESNRYSFIEQRELLDRAPEQTRMRRSPLHWNSLVSVSGKQVRIGNNPDHFFAINDNNRPEDRITLNFFLEADRGTETVRPIRRHLNKATIYRKLLGYYNTHQNKLHQSVFGEHMNNFRVLWVVDSEGKDNSGRTRIENMLNTAHEATGGALSNLFLITSYKAFKSNDLFEVPWVNGAGNLQNIST